MEAHVQVWSNPRPPAKGVPLKVFTVSFNGTDETSDAARDAVRTAVADFAKVHPAKIKVSHKVGGGFIAHLPMEKK